MVANLTILTHKIEIQLHLVAESCSIYSSRSRRSVQKLLDTLSYVYAFHASCLFDKIYRKLFGYKGKGKVIPVFFLTANHAMNAY
jgi:hypothetical protein